MIDLTSLKNVIFNYTIFKVPFFPENFVTPLFSGNFKYMYYIVVRRNGFARREVGVEREVGEFRMKICLCII